MKHKSGNLPGKVLAMFEERKAKIKELPITPISFTPQKLIVQGEKNNVSNSFQNIIKNDNHTKYKLLAAIGIIWKKYPYLRLGELINYAIGNNLSEVEDEVLQEALINFDPKYINLPICGALPNNRSTYCSLTINHIESFHYNENSDFIWSKDS